MNLNHIPAKACALLIGAVVSLSACSKSSDVKSPAALNPTTQADSTPSPSGSPAAPGPGAKLVCTSSGKNAWDTYGANAFVAVNKRIFANVTAEINANGTQNLGASLTRIGSGDVPATRDNAATFEGKLAAFLVYVYGGPAKITYTDGKTYDGPQDMVTTHTGLGITNAQYDYFVSNIIVPALTSNGVPTGDISSCFAPPLIDPAFKASIVGK